MTKFNVEGDIVFRALVIGELCTANPISEISLEIPYFKDLFFCQLDPTTCVSFAAISLFTGIFESNTVS
jgi:hypothetical protein